MNLKKLFIPKENAQETTELQSFTVSWEVYTGYTMNDTSFHVKVFINKGEAEEFKKQLEESAKFTKAWIRTKLKEN